MLLSLLLLAGMADWVPMRWTSPDPASLELLKDTPVNCLLLERNHWFPYFVSAAGKTGTAILGVVRPSDGALDAVRQASANKLTGVVFEGDFEDAVLTRLRSTASDSKLAVVELRPRAKLQFDTNDAIIGTYQGVWPGIQVDDGGSAKAAPSGAPWINTNSGFLRFVRAASKAEVWLGNTPPANTIVTGERYQQAIADAAMVGAKWIIAFDDEYAKLFYARDAKVMQEWKAMAAVLAHFENNRQWRSMDALGQLAIVQDVDSGALLSGGILDMIAVKHTPVRPVPSRQLSAAALEHTEMAVNVDPSSLTDTQKDSLRAFARRGGTLLTAPSTWKFPAPEADAITLKDEDVKILDDIWKEVNSMTGRRNLGARLFNVSSMLSNALQTSDGKRTVLHLVNYSGYPVENVTIHLLGKHKAATVLHPGGKTDKTEIYENEEGTGIDIPGVNVLATVIVE